MSTGIRRILKEGLVAGLLGYLSVAAFFAIVNLLQGQHILYTSALLGSGLLFNLTDATQVSMEAAPIYLYNGIHLLVSVSIGMLAAWLIFVLEHHRALWYVLFFALFAGFVYSLILVGIVTIEMLPLLSWWMVVAANLLGATVTVGYLLWAHPSLLRDVREDVEAA